MISLILNCTMYLLYFPNIILAQVLGYMRNLHCSHSDSASLIYVVTQLYDAFVTNVMPALSLLYLMRSEGGSCEFYKLETWVLTLLLFSFPLWW